MKFITFITIGSLLLLSGCTIQSPSSIKIDESWVSVKAPWVNIEVGDSGVSIDASGSSLRVWPDGIELTGEALSQWVWLYSREINDVNCDTQYDGLLKTYGNNYDGCFSTYPDIPECSKDWSEKGKINIAVIFDTSGSMWAKIGEERMIDIAKEKLSEYISNLDTDVSWGIILYGHKWNSTDAEKSNSCNGVELLWELGSDRSKLLSDIASLEPRGWTPIDRSLQTAETFLKNLSSPNDKNIILLISDGKETCDGDPVGRAKSIASTPNMYIDVIGFNVTGWAQEELINIAKNGNGKYSDVRSRLDFESVFAANKNFLTAMSCSASKASLHIQAAIERKNTYYSCLYMLKEEEVKIITNSTVSCKDSIMDRLEKRSDQYTAEIEKIDQISEKLLESFDENINKIENSFEF